MNPNMAFIFPGQGSQKIGMGREFYDNFPEAREVFEAVDEALGRKLSSVIFGDDETELTNTVNAQPAIMANSMAILRVFEKAANFTEDDYKSKLRFVAGHSLGEYTALAAIRAISIDEAARLLSIRGEAMQQAIPEGVGGMLAILGAEQNKVEEICKISVSDGEICSFANDNAPGQIVISGHMSAIDKAIAICKEQSLKAIKLPVSTAFHCDLMKPAAESMRKALDDCDMKEPLISVVANVSANSLNDIDEIKDSLVEQVTGSVRWLESVEYMAKNGVEKIVEIGEGRTLNGMVKRIDRGINLFNIGKIDDIDETVKNI